MESLGCERNVVVRTTNDSDLIAYVLSWDSVRRQGYLSDGSRTLRFSESNVLDSCILNSLDDGEVHQLVCCTCLQDRNVPDGNMPVATVLRLLTGMQGSDFLGMPRENARMRASRLFIDGRVDEAAREYEKLLNRDKNNIETVKALIEVYVRSRKCNLAIDLFAKTVDLLNDREAFGIASFTIDCLAESCCYKDAISVVNRMLGRTDLDWRMGNWLRSRQVTFENMIDKTSSVQVLDLLEMVPREISLGFDRIIQDFCDIDDKKVDQAMEFVRGLPAYGLPVTFTHTQALAVLRKAIAYFQAPAYLSKCDYYNEILRMVDAFEREFISKDKSNRPVGVKLLEMLRSLCSQIRSHLVRRAEENVPITINSTRDKCDTENGMLCWRLHVFGGDQSYPPVRSFTLSFEDRQDVVPVTCECHDDDGVEILLRFSPTEDELLNRVGEAHIKVDYLKRISPCLIDDKNLGTVLGETRRKMQFLVSGDELPERFENPYESLKCPKDGFFVGRREVMSELTRMFSPNSQGTGLVLYGQHYCGKTTMMDNFLVVLEKDPRFLVTRLNGQNWSGNNVSTEIEFLTALATKNDLEIDGDAFKLRLCLEAFGNKIRQEGKTWVVGIDEFTKPYTECYTQERNGTERDGKREKLKQYLSCIRAFLDDGIFNLLLIGQEDTGQFFDDSDFSNAMSRIKRHRLSFLAPDAIREYAMVPVNNQDVRNDFYRGRSLDLIVRWTGGSPWMAWKLMTKIFDVLIKIRYPIVQECVVEMAVTRLMDGADNGSLSRMDFEPFLCLRSSEFADDDIEDFYRRLIMVSEEGAWVPMSFLADNLLYRKLTALLCEREVLERRNENVRLRVRLFDRWLRNNIETIGG